MRIIVTAGGTSERIDGVRRLTNIATGRLGALIAGELSRRTDAEIVYLCGEGAVIPDEKITVRQVGPVSELRESVVELLSDGKAAALIHSMAVGDYACTGYDSLNCMAEKAASALYADGSPPSGRNAAAVTILRALQDADTEKLPDKLSSDIGGLILRLAPTEKIISIVKRLSPATLLVGFKLTPERDADAVFRAGFDILTRNSCDYVLANSLYDISHDRHEGVFIRPDRSCESLSGKPEIARVIAETVIRDISVRD